MTYHKLVTIYAQSKVLETIVKPQIRTRTKLTVENCVGDNFSEMGIFYCG